jgi:tripartite-type tricarboxylate transporter receptor subunit TctC
VGELIALAKTKPGEISYATSGVGAAGHVNVALLETMAGVKLQAVHYRGAAPALNDVIAGHVQLTSVAVSSALQPWRSGLVKMLGIGSAKRMAQLPDVPTVAESGLPGYEAITWFGLFTTAGTPREIIGKINAEVQALFADQAFLDRAIVPNMFESMVSSPEQFAEFIRSDSAKWSKVLREANVKAE